MRVDPGRAAGGAAGRAAGGAAGRAAGRVQRHVAAGHLCNYGARDVFNGGDAEPLGVCFLNTVI